MDRSTGSLAFALTLLLTLSPASAQQRAKCRTLYPPYAIATDDAQFVADPYEEGTWDGRMIASKHSNGDDSLEMLRLSINPGRGWPPHRHLEADEWIYVLSGAGAYSYWALEELQPTKLIVSPGHALYNPQGQLHKIWNTGEEPLVLLAVSKSLAPYEVLSDWPDSPGGGLGYVPHAAPWEISCAPGHELDGDGGANAAEFLGGDSGSGGAAGEPAERRAAGEVPAAEEDYGSAAGEDYESSGCGCGSEPMNESDIAACMAEPDDEAGEYDESTEGYGREGEYGSDEEEPEFSLDEPWTSDGYVAAGHDAGEL